jgi:type IV pilus assembly protein PilW
MHLMHRTQHPHRALRTARGFSLVELMVAMTLSLLLLGGVVAIFGSSRASYETTDRLSRIQETGRFALDQIVADLRGAGFPGCARVPTYVTITLANSTDVKWNYLDAPVRGFQYVSPGSYTPAISTSNDVPGAAGQSDVLVVRRAKPDAVPMAVQVDMANTTEIIKVANAAASGLSPNDHAMISDCKAVTYFQATNVVGADISHVVTGLIPAPNPNAPGNASNDLQSPYVKNAQVMPIQTVLYYIAPSGPGSAANATSLWRRIGGGAPAEIAEGVEQMQLRFGIDTNDDFIVDGAYVTANLVPNWNNVRAVEVALLVQSLDGYGTDRDEEAYDLLGVPVPAHNDNRMREVFTATVSLRNRIMVN